jgi:hypothetical protein
LIREYYNDIEHILENVKELIARAGAKVPIPSAQVELLESRVLARMTSTSDQV